MQRVLTLYQTTIGKKALMAASGVVLLGYVIGHLLGNLKLYQGPQAINEYAAFLRTVPAVLWGTRFLVAGSVLVHVFAAVQLATRNGAARPIAYHSRRDQVTNYAARTMYWSGPILLLYLLYHLAHLTFGFTPDYEFDRHNVYNNLVYGFQNPVVSGVYIVGNLALGIHLFHGAWALFNSLGLNHPRYNQLRRYFAMVVAAVLTIGNLSFPVAVMAGWVEPTTESFFFPELE